MPDPAFVDRLNEQIGYEFGASQQYVAAAVYYDSETLPRLAAFFYAQALEERNHAMMMVQYLMDADAQVVIPGIEAPQGEFADIVPCSAADASTRARSRPRRSRPRSTAEASCWCGRGHPCRLR